MDFLDLAKRRYSCKKYSPRPVEAEKLSVILEAGRWAPTAKNGQEQHVYVLQSPQVLSKIDALTPCRYGAPVVLAVAWDATRVYPYPGDSGRESGAEDASIVATHLMLAAADQGVDSCWVNFIDPDAAAKALDLPENEKLLMLLDLGYAAEGGGPLPNHASRKALAETVTYL